VSAVPAPRRLRLAHLEEVPPVTITLDETDGAVSSDTLVLVRPTRGWPVLPPATAARTRTVAVQLCLPGIAGRYVRRIAAAAAATGWKIDQLAALVGELERRCSYVLAAPAPVRVGPPGRRGIRGTTEAVAWHGGRWTRGGRTTDAFRHLTQTARARGDTAAAAASGHRLPRIARRLLEVLEAENVHARIGSTGVAAELRCTWAVEAFACPRITSDHLLALRDRFAAAPRCDWCGVPVVGRSCRRCVPGDPA
jgi:hypothetical protein